MDPYLARGVSSQKTDVKQAVAQLDAGLYPDTFCKVLPDVWAGSPDHCVALHTDTAGTKAALAYLYWRETGDLSVWQDIVQDAIVMNLDDLLCIGAIEGFVFSSALARNRNVIPAEVIQTLVLSGANYLQTITELGASCILAGGETADVGDVVRTIDVGFTAAVRMRRVDIIQIQPQPGDVVLGFRSDRKLSYENKENSGIGCNGLTLARHLLFNEKYKQLYPETYDPYLDSDLVYAGPYTITDTIEGSALNIGQMTLAPTRTYTPALKNIIQNYRAQLHGIVHNTGGGHSKCKSFLKNVDIIKTIPALPPKIFQLIQQVGKIDDRNLMYRTFNMGYRMELYTDESTALKIQTEVAAYGLQADIIGKVIEGTGKVTICLPNTNTNIYFD